MSESAADYDADDVIQRLSLSHVDDGQDNDDDHAPEVFADSSAASASASAAARKTPSASRDDKTRKSSSSGGESSKSSKKTSAASGKDSGSILKRILPGGSSGSSSTKSHHSQPAGVNGSSAKTPQSHAPNGTAKITREQLAAVKVDRLPQRFVLKYLGHKACGSLWGIKNTRPLVDELVAELKSLPTGEDLPLVNVLISPEGITASLHRQNTSKRPLADKGLTPLEFVSYAVQDTRYPRVAAFILVRELSSRSRVTECHAYLCDTALAARQVALSVALAFKTYAKRMEGKPHRFQVDLRSPDELKAELAGSGATAAAATAGRNGEDKVAAECDA